MVEYTFGSGTFIAMCPTLEYGYANGWALGGIINNALTYCFNKTSNLIINFLGDTLSPCKSVDIPVIISAKNLIGGNYICQIESNAPANPNYLVPVILHVSGYPELVFNTDTIEFYKVFVESTDTMRKVINNNGTGF